MTEKSVCAVIITYHPSNDMIENLSMVLAQVQGLVLVDNGSNEDELSSLRRASRTLDFHLIENGENLGIAEALNQGVRWAKEKGYPWVILFDQDSKITQHFIEQLFTAWMSHQDRDRVCSIHPTYLSPITGTTPRIRRASDGGPEVSMTSGALMPTWIFDKIGMFASEYFIDLVDHEYCLRIRAAGYLIADTKKAVLLHSAGHPEKISLLGFSFHRNSHSAVRHYYISRNRFALYRKYLRVFPFWVLYSIYHDFFRGTIRCLIVENNRIRNFHNFLIGTWDGLAGRMGKR